MKRFWNLTAFAFLSATLIGCGGEAQKPGPAPKIDLGSSSESTDAPAGNTEPTVDQPKAGENEVAVAPKAGVVEGGFDPTAEALKLIKTMKVKPDDWPQWGGSQFRNNVPEGKGIATEWS